MFRCLTGSYARITLLVLSILTLTVPEAPARQALSIFTPDGRPFLLLDIYKKGEVFGTDKFDSRGESSTWTLQDAERDALRNASDYWSTLIGQASKNARPMRVTVGLYDEDGGQADAISLYVNNFTELADGLINGRDTYDAVAQIRIGYSMGAPHRDYTGLMEVLPHNGDPSHLSHALAHEIGHAMGIASTVSSETHSFSTVLGMWDQHLYDSNG